MDPPCARTPWHCNPVAMGWGLQKAPGRAQGLTTGLARQPGPQPAWAPANLFSDDSSFFTSQLPQPPPGLFSQVEAPHRPHPPLPSIRGRSSPLLTGGAHTTSLDLQIGDALQSQDGGAQAPGSSLATFPGAAAGSGSEAKQPGLKQVARWADGITGSSLTWAPTCFSCLHQSEQSNEAKASSACAVAVPEGRGGSHSLTG